MKKVLFPILALVLALGLSLPMAAGASPGPGIVGLWHLDDNALDSSGNANHGTVYGGATYVSGMFDNALSFDGSDDYVDCGSVLDVTNKLTVEAWVKDSGNSGGNVVGKYEAMNKRWHIYVNSGADGKIYWNIGGWNFGTSLTSAIGTDWHHLAMVYDGTQTGNSNRLKAYIDGAPITLTFTGTIPATMPAISANVNIGRHSTSNFFQGTIDEVRIWDEALTANQIQQSMASPAPVIVTTSLSGPSVVAVGAEVSWDITIEVCNYDNVAVTGVVVQDGMGADLDGITEVSISQGSATYLKKGRGRMGATMVTWDVGDLDAGECATLVVTVTTGTNAKGKHSFTSAEEDHDLDGGASATYWYGDPALEYETPETVPLTVEVIEGLSLENKDSTWKPIADGTWGVMTYNLSGTEFVFDFNGYGLEATTNYSLIYYADFEDRFNIWGGNNPGALIATGIASGGSLTMSGSIDLGIDLPDPSDANAYYHNYADPTDLHYTGDGYATAYGAKIWLVPSECYNATAKKVIAWSPARYLFETDLITYTDTGP